MAADEKKMLSTFNRLTLVARHLSRSPAALIGTRRCESSLSNRNLLINHPRKMYRIEERGAPNTLEHRIFFREFACVTVFTFSSYLGQDNDSRFACEISGDH